MSIGSGTSDFFPPDDLSHVLQSSAPDWNVFREELERLKVILVSRGPRTSAIKLLVWRKENFQRIQ